MVDAIRRNFLWLLVHGKAALIAVCVVQSKAGISIYSSLLVLMWLLIHLFGYKWEKRERNFIQFCHARLFKRIVYYYYCWMLGINDISNVH